MLALLAFSLIAASCSNSSDSDGGSPSPTLPATVGDNPIKAETTLKHSDYDSLIMKTNGTAEYYEDNDKEYVFKYTWDTTKKEIYMVVEKIPYDDDTMLNYDEAVSQINKYPVAKVRENLQEEFESWQTQRHQDYGAKTYEEYEAALLEDYGCKSLEEYVNLMKEYSLKYLKSIFGTKVTYKYEIEDDKMVLTEKFTGVKNLLQSECRYSKDGTEVYIDSYSASIYKYNNSESEDWGGEFGTGNNITFEEYDSKEKKTGSYTEDIANETVIVTFDGKNYPCEFRGNNFIED